MATIIGTTVTSRIEGGDKFRVVWTRSFAAILPAFTFDAVGAARDIQEWLPSIGCIPVSAPSAKAGDEVIVYDIRIAISKTGRTVSQLLADLESEPHYMIVSRLEKISLTTTSAQLEQGQAEAIQAGNEDANAPLTKLGDIAEATGKSLLLIALLIGVAAAVYFSRNR